MSLYGNGFRPLDGESFSKRDIIHAQESVYSSFRPLDGESFSKRITRGD